LSFFSDIKTESGVFMKKQIFVVLGLFCGVLTLAAAEYSRVFNMSIQLPEKYNQAELFAAQELELHLKKIFSAPARLNGQQPETITFYVGISDAVRRGGFEPVAAEKLAGKFGICRRGNDFLFYGEDTPDGDIERLKDKFGTLSAVEYFLQKYLGVKFFLPGEKGIKYLHNVEIVFNADADYPNPSYEVRCFQRMAKDVTLSEGSLFFRRRLGAVPEYAAHDFYYDFLGTWNKRFKHKPEMFALHEGKRICGNYPRHFPCLSHPDVIPQIVSDVTQAMEKNPKIRTIRFFCDAPVKGCECDSCVNSPVGKLTQGSDSSEIVYSLLCKVARELQKKDPDLWFHTHTKGSSYYQVPRTEKLPPNVVIFILTSQFQPPRLEDVKPLIDMWRNAGATVMLKAYPRAPWMKDYPIMNPHRIAGFFKLFQGLSKGSVMVEGRPNIPYVFSALNNYVHSAVVFDSSVDVDKLVTEFCCLTAPEAAAELEDFYNAMEKLLEDAVFTAEPLRNCYLSFRLKTPREHLNRALAKAPENEFLQKLSGEFARFEKISAAESPKIGSEAELKEIYNSFERKKAPLTLSEQADRSELLPFSIYFDWQKSFAAISRRDNQLKINITCHENTMAKLKTSCKNNHQGPVWNDDSVEVFITPADKPQPYIQLVINPLGTYRVMYCDEKGKVTDKRDFDFAVDAVRKADSWQVDIAIPFRSLAPFKKDNAVNLGVYRNRPARGKDNTQQSGIQKPQGNLFKDASGHFRVNF